MKRANPMSAEPDLVAKAEAEAAVWLGLCDRGLSSEQEAEFAQWLEADPRHAAAYAQFEETWQTFGGDAAQPLVEGEPNPDLLAPSGVEGLAPSGVEGVAASQRESTSRQWWRAPLLGGLAAAAAITVGVFIWTQAAPRTVVHEAFVTELGTITTKELPDGSVVQLNTDSKIDVSFSAEERRVRLVQGEAHFTVAKNPARPFYVTAGPVTVRAVGTAFNVRFSPAEVVVLVTEGKVRVDDTSKGGTLLSTSAPAPATQPRGEEPLLAAGQRAVFPLVNAEIPQASVVATVPAEDITRTLAWREKRLEFSSVTLAEAVAEFNRYNRHQLVIADPQLGQQRFGGTFEANGYDAFVRLLERSFGVKAERLPDKTILRSGP